MELKIKPDGQDQTTALDILNIFKLTPPDTQLIMFFEGAEKPTQNPRLSIPLRMGRGFLIYSFWSDTL
ncbi:MAG: hypothetical protein DRP47_07795 [Candidatus Zixiibacteriota bacterium]|nr:MAG: hypothetical protein DRP47_07795 [candidate division Zixibacteria bacterium]